MCVHVQGYVCDRRQSYDKKRKTTRRERETLTERDDKEGEREGIKHQIQTNYFLCLNNYRLPFHGCSTISQQFGAAEHNPFFQIQYYGYHVCLMVHGKSNVMQ